jgi:Cell wall-active antibiotics response 4TMS YvqF
MRPLRALGLLTAGSVAGFAAAAALVKRMLPSKGGADSDEVALVAVFDGIDLESRAQAFRGGSMLAWYGGIAVDLREAKLAPQAHLDLHAIFGGVAVRVPEGWRIESRMKALAGGVAVDVPEPDDPAAPTLTLDGFAAFGGVAVGTKTPASK